jgi:O-antigen/teichoic acid export membrane protein
VVQHLSSGEATPAHTFQLAFTIQTIAATLIAGAVLIFGGAIQSIVLKGSTDFRVYLCLLVIVQAWHGLFSGTLQGLRLYRAYIAGELARSLSRLVLMLLLVTRLKLGADGLMLSAILGIFIASILQAVAIPFPKRFWASVPALRRTAAFALPLAAIGALGVTFDRLNRLILGFWSGPVSLAVFEVASRVPDAGTQAYMGFQSAFFPNMSAVLGAGDKRYAATVLNQTLRLICFATSIAVFIPFVFRRELVTLLFSREYAEAAVAFGLLLPAVVVRVANNLLHTTLIASGNTRAALSASVFQCVVNTVLYLILIPRIGYLGAAYGYVAGNVLVTPVVFWMVRRQGIKVRASAYVKPLVLFALSIGIATVVNLTWVALLAALVFFIVSAGLTKCITKDDIRLVVRASARGIRSEAVAAA